MIFAWNLDYIWGRHKYDWDTCGCAIHFYTYIGFWIRYPRLAARCSLEITPIWPCESHRRLRTVAMKVLFLSYDGMTDIGQSQICPP